MTKKKKIIEPEYHEKERSKRKIRLVYYRKVAMVNQKTCSKKISALLLLLVNERLAAERNFKIKLHFIWCGSASKATLNTFIHSLRVHTNTCACGQTAMISFLRVWDNIRDYDVMIVLHRVKQQSNHTYTITSTAMKESSHAYWQQQKYSKYSWVVTYAAVCF